MDKYELCKNTARDTTPRRPLVPADKTNAAVTNVVTTRQRMREVNSRYRSSTPTPTPRRCQSPTSHAELGLKRAISVPSTPPSPPNSSSPACRRLSTGTGRLPEGLWPSTMRSLSVSFQSETISIPISKKEKPVSSYPSTDCTLRRPFSNIARKPDEKHTGLRKPTPERKRSPLKGRNVADSSENAKPLDRRWPTRIKSRDIEDNLRKNSSTPLRRIPNPHGLSQKSASDVSRLVSVDEGSRFESEAKLLQELEPNKPVFMTTAVSRTQSMPVIRPPSPCRTLSSWSSSSSSSSASSSIARGASPSRVRSSTPPPSRRKSPARIRAPMASSQISRTTSVLSFIADLKKGKRIGSYIEDAHQLRLLHNRNIQWRFSNARAEAALYMQKMITEETLYNVLDVNLSLWDSVIRKRISLQKLKLELKLKSILNEHMPYLEDWAVRERDHDNSLARTVEDLQATTLRLPVTGKAVANIEPLKAAIFSAVDVMQAMGSCICSLQSKVDGMNSAISKVAGVAAQEKRKLDEVESLLASREAVQVKEYSLRSQIIQMKHT